ncbi:MAG: GGDEF and EAL domain-containing protein [Myxococcales bacterium]
MGDGGGVIWVACGGLALILLGILASLFARRTARAELALEEHLRHPLQREGSGPWVWELENDRLRYTPASQPLLAGAPNPCPSEAWFARVHQEDLGALRELLDTHLAGRTERVECVHRLRHEDGSFRWVSVHARRDTVDSSPAGRVLGWWTDLSSQPGPVESGLQPAFRDALTGLPNARLFLDRVIHAVARAGRNPSRRFAVMFVDLADFTAINQRLGRSIGDQLLLSVATRLESSVRPGDTVARVGSDEFALLLEDADASADALAVGERIRRALLAPMPTSGSELMKGPSIGLVLGDGSLFDAHEILRRAREAARESKSESQGRPVLFDPDMHDKAVERTSMERSLRGAVERGQLTVHYQPMIDLATGSITGFEALARWRHPTLGFVSPLSFIPLAEDTGLISELGAWILFESLTQLKKWQDQVPSERPLRINVNLSTRQLREDKELLQRIVQALDRTGVAPQCLALEVTESLLLDEAEDGRRLVTELRDRGVGVCLDDFGTGYSSLSYLHRARVDGLKIDLTFVRHLTDDSQQAEIVRTILTLSKALGLPAIAEGVETEAQLARLRELGCEGAQGYLFSPPVDADSAEVLLRSGRRW